MYQTGQTYKANCHACRANQAGHCEGQETSTIKMDGNMSEIYGLNDNPTLYSQFSNQHQYTCQVTGMTKVHETKEIKRFLITEEIADLV